MSTSDNITYLNLLSFFSYMLFLLCSISVALIPSSFQVKNLEVIFHFYSLSPHISPGMTQNLPKPFSHVPLLFWFHVLIIFLLDYSNNLFYFNPLSWITHSVVREISSNANMIIYISPVQNFAVAPCPNFQQGNISLPSFPNLLVILTLLHTLPSVFLD